MHIYLGLKTLHVLGALLFFGVGLGSAWYKFMADRSGDVRVILWCQNQIVRADYIFTATSAVIIPITGIMMARRIDLPLETPWVLASIIGYLVAGALWLPAAWLQMRMREYAELAVETDTPLPEEFHRANRIWFWLGVPAFILTVAVMWTMVAKWHWLL